MNSPSPIIPESSTPEQRHQGRKRFYIAFFTIVGANAMCLVLLLLIQGCKRQPEGETQINQTTTTDPSYSTTTTTITDTNPVVPMDTNSVVAVTDSNASPVHVETPITPVVSEVPAAREHVIVKGDMLGDIAKKYNVTLAALKAANPTVDEKRLQIGKKLVIPAPAPAPAADASAGAAPTTPVATGETVHTVKSGDTLGALAKKYGTTVPAIQDANGLKDTRIKVGDKLKIPAKSATP